jgi:hypothetical protein
MSQSILGAIVDAGEIISLLADLRIFSAFEMTTSDR